MKLKYTVLFIALVGFLISSCKKGTTLYDNPYAGAKPPLGIVTDPQQVPVPASGIAGTTVSIAATGLLPYKDQLSFLFNGQTAKITEVTATGIKVVVPASASSGVTAFVVNGQLVFGPLFTVIGNVNIDPTYVNTVGADGAVLKAFPVPLSTQLIILGAFQNYNNAGAITRTSRIVRVFADGSWDRSFQVGKGANSTLYDMAQVGPYYYVVGDLTGFAQQGGLVNRIARISTNGVIDTVSVTTYLKKVKFVPTFDAGVTGGSIHAIYPVGNNKMVVTGSFNFYVSHRYDQNTYDYKDSVITDSVDVRQIARFNVDGTLDKTWRFDSTAVGYKPNKKGKSSTAANGPIQTIGHSDGKILVYGKFSTFDDKPANNILRLNADGTVDPTFNPGTGPDQEVDWVSYNATVNKYLVCGLFNNYNGKPAKYLVQLNYDGSIDAGFNTKVFDGGVPSFVKLLGDGVSIVNGNFKSYDGVIRNYFAVLDPTGALKPGYNTIGNVSGPILDIYETTSADNKRALLIMGNFYTFDNKIRNNIVRVTFQ
jgi:hypothetical protein